MLPRVRFDRPPVIEVVCGVQFDDLSAFRLPHVGIFWSSLRGEFPETAERPPLDPMIEVTGSPSLRFELVQTPPVPRVWLITANGSNLIQIQRDRFLYNWKRVTEADAYPSYDKVIVEFEAQLERFRKFLASERLGAMVFRQYELTYVNHIAKGNGLELSGEYRVLIDHQRNAAESRFLPEPEGFNWRTAYALPDESGRLHIHAQSAIRKSGERIVRLDLTARGMPKTNDEAARRPWFDLAHDWITHGFADATSRDLHKAWGRTQ